MKNKVALTIATWFGCGYFPVGPGTAGSLAGLGIAFLCQRYAGLQPYWFGIFAILLLLPGIWASTIAADVSGRKDPGLVVVDEVIGQWITLSGATVLNWKSWAAAFVLFRVLDIWKPAPARRLESLPGGTGIVMDDVMAGIYGALVLFAAGCFNLY
ncbi:MAG: phosphatidylglycerophosphatase A [Bryobacteraceae bacterium]